MSNNQKASQITEYILELGCGIKSEYGSNTLYACIKFSKIDKNKKQKNKKHCPKKKI